MHRVWNDNRDDETPGQSEIYHKRSTDGGATWGSDTRLTFHEAVTLSYGIHPSVFVSGARAHLFWNDSRDRSPDGNGPNYEVYYRRLR